MVALKVLPREFYERNPEAVAKELLGKKLIRKLDKEVLEGIIVETEAYYGLEDPASRAYHGLKNYNRLMWSESGYAFIYSVHNNWMFNIIAHEPNGIGAVLVRAIEPTKGVDLMKSNRKIEDIYELTKGPGKLTKALKIDNGLNGVSVTSAGSEIVVADNEMRIEVGSSQRIGVRRDLPKELRFFVKANRFVSKDL